MILGGEDENRPSYRIIVEENLDSQEAAERYRQIDSRLTSEGYGQKSRSFVYQLIDRQGEDHCVMDIWGEPEEDALDILEEEGGGEATRLPF